MSSSSSSSSSSSFSSCSSSSCSSSSFSSSSCSSSYNGFTAPKNSVTDGNFEILGQTNNGYVLVNSGVAYDGYGNRLAVDDRTWVKLDFSTVGAFGYLCLRRRSEPALLDYQDHPHICLPRPTKRRVEVEFYLSSAIVKVNLNNGYAYYPPLDSNGIIEGVVLGCLYTPPLDEDKKPIMDPFRSPLMAVKDGSFFALTGFNTP